MGEGHFPVSWYWGGNVGRWVSYMVCWWWNLMDLVLVSALPLGELNNRYLIWLRKCDQIPTKTYIHILYSRPSQPVLSQNFHPIIFPSCLSDHVWPFCNWCVDDICCVTYSLCRWIKGLGGKSAHDLSTKAKQGFEWASVYLVYMLIRVSDGVISCAPGVAPADDIWISPTCIYLYCTSRRARPAAGSNRWCCAGI